MKTFVARTLLFILNQGCLRVPNSMPDIMMLVFKAIAINDIYTCSFSNDMCAIL